MNNVHPSVSVRLFFLLAVSPWHGQLKSKALQYLPAAITKISYSRSAGRGGNGVNLEITPNAIVYVQSHNGAEKTIREKTPRSLWSSMTRAINNKDLSQIKSAPGHALYDGIDVTITVEKGRERYSIVNGNEDAANFKRIKGLSDILEAQSARLDKRIHW